MRYVIEIDADAPSAGITSTADGVRFGPCVILVHADSKLEWNSVTGFFTATGLTILAGCPERAVFDPALTESSKAGRPDTPSDS